MRGLPVSPVRSVLAIGAHTDDIELGCGGLLSRLQRDGAEIHAIAFSRAEASLPPHMAPDTLEKEFHASMAVLGVPEERAIVGTVPVRRFPEFRQQVLDRLVELRRDTEFDLVLTMNSSDTHQDHEVVHKESVRAFRGVTLLGYEIPWNQQQNVTSLYAELDEVDVERKVQMLASYQSQADLGRPYMDPTYARSAAIHNGFMARKPLAEAFEVITMMWALP